MPNMTFLQRINPTIGVYTVQAISRTDSRHPESLRTEDFQTRTVWYTLATCQVLAYFYQDIPLMYAQ
jgi:hypothetical protein